MTPSCPVCGKPALAASKPFCSPHCAQIDLGRWFTGQYAIPGRDGEASAHGHDDDQD